MHCHSNLFVVSSTVNRASKRSNCSTQVLFIRTFLNPEEGPREPINTDSIADWFQSRVASSFSERMRAPEAPTPTHAACDGRALVEPEAKIGNVVTTLLACVLAQFQLLVSDHALRTDVIFDLVDVFVEIDRPAEDRTFVP